MPTELAASEAFALENRIVEHIHRIRQGWALLASDLYHFHQKRCWEDLGYTTLQQWLASPHVEISRRMFFLMVETYRNLIVERGVDLDTLGHLDISKVQTVLPALRRGQIKLDEALADATALPLADLREKYRDIRPLDDGPDRSISPDEYHFERCSMCGTLLKLDENNLIQGKNAAENATVVP